MDWGKYPIGNRPISNHTMGVMKNGGTPFIKKSGSSPVPDRKIPRHRILLADDEPLIRQLCTELLDDLGYEVDTAEDGAAAWDALQIKGYDLLITDNEMPQVSGIELLKKLRAARMTLPVIMVSGTMPTAELKRHPELHLDAALLKPFDVTEFTGVVKKALRAADGVANSARLFRECAMEGSQISPAENPANATIGDQTNPFHRILVVDDDKDTRQLSVDVLTGSGYDVECVKDGADGWEALQNNSYDLVITDNKMPRMTGMEMIEKLRSARMTVPVIMATGALPRHVIAKTPWLKPDAMLQRPFSNDDLLNTVRNVLSPGDGDKSGEASLLPI
jgi:DNA-binding response OmpR family regulator